MARADRIKLLLLMALFAAPALAAWIARDVWRPSGMNNYGELVEPRAPRIAGLVDIAGSPADLGALRGHWVLLTVVGGDCDEACRKQIHLGRQVRIAQGREQGRVVRAVVGVSARPMLGLFGGPIADEPDLKIYAAPGAALSAWTGGGPARTYVMDPLGRVMLRFPADPEGKGMVRDLRQLLKASKIG